MTFVLSQIDNDGILMASDSSETHTDHTGSMSFIEVDKTLHFKALNIGISTWGDAEVRNQSINEWLDHSMAEFVNQRKSNKVLEEVTEFLAEKLDDAFGLDGSTLNHSIHMGLHIAGYNSLPERTPPGICHVFIEPRFHRFDPQKTVLCLPPHAPGYHLRNGMYEEFVMMWPALSGIDASLRAIPILFLQFRL